MNRLPKIKIDYFYKEIAKELNIPVDDVVSVYRHYRNHIEDEFKSCVVVDMYKFGKFSLAPIWTTNSWDAITRRIIWNELTMSPEELEEDVMQKVNLSLQIKLEEKIEKISKYEKHHRVKERFEEHTLNFKRDHKQSLQEKINRGDFPGATLNLQTVPEELRYSEDSRLQDEEN